MNPVTRALLNQLNDPHLAEFVARWDALEALIIRVFRTGLVVPSDRREHRRLLRWLRPAYPAWQPGLDAFWRATTINDQPLGSDPFADLLAVDTAASIIDNWPAMQTLPAARQALNEYIAWLLDEDAART